MRFSPFVDRIGGVGSTVWELHNRAARDFAEGRDVIVLSAGDPDFDTPAPIVNRLVESLKQGRTHYAPAPGEPELRQAVARHHQQTTGQAVGPEQVVIVPGTQCGLFSSLQCVAGPGDDVIVADPMYATYAATVGASGAQLVPVAAQPSRHFHLDPADVAAAITPCTRAILLNTPHNPTGAVLSHDELLALAELCHQHDLWLISDEVYAPLAYDQPHISPCRLPGMDERCITLNSLSKSHAMTGWRMGWVVGPSEFVQHMDNLTQCMLYGCPPFIQDAAVHALSRDFEELVEMRHAFRWRRDMVLQRLAQRSDISCHKPEGGIYIMIDIRRTGQSPAIFTEELYAKYGVALLSGDAFGPSANGHVRLSLSCDDKLIEDACNRLAHYLDTL